ncbi:MAG: adenine deaminase [Phycisphaerae bacterium]|nr:adenine deaminase [Phycisphaerae bacterium]
MHQADPITPELLAVARSDAPADLALANARIINVFSGEIITGTILIHQRRIAAVLSGGEPYRSLRTADCAGSFVAPGFIDAHMHVESTMMPPSEFVTLASPHGTTGVVLDPHEIANVLGIPGIRALMDNARGVPLHCMFAASSCVPSCHLETSGARLEAADLAPLFDDDRVVALAEMMNFPGAALGDPGVLAKINLGLTRRIVDGHAPGLTGRWLQAYAGAGISSDHECTRIDEAREKLRAGIRIFIRQGSAARNLEALLPLITDATRSRFCFCTDDRHPADLKIEGHIDHVVRLAIAGGLDPVAAITIGSFNTAQHYRQRDRGAVAPGYFADLIVFDDLKAPRPRQVYFEGALVAEHGNYLPIPSNPAQAAKKFPASAVRLPPNLTEASFRVPAPKDAHTHPQAPPRIRVIGMDPHQLVTEHLTMDASVKDGAIVPDIGRDLLKMAVIERHKGGGNIGLGFVKGFGLKRGAIASTVGHDAHNLAIVSTNDADMLAAARALSQAGGGQCAVVDGRVLSLLPLPIAGLMSDQPSETLIKQQHALHEATRTLGCPHADPFMPLSFMPLPVIPQLKLSDLGLVDVEKFALVGLVVS